ncbi:MAG: phenylacetate--CoA ligase [Anaerofustis stercorihominis]|nr:phenylacetate--CoA ligase [Anaerofustis stercorihominis]
MKVNIWNEKAETMSRDELHHVQSLRFKDMVWRIYHNVPFYRQALDEKGITPSDIKDIDDLKYMPFTTKTDLRDNYPKGLFAVPDKEVVRIHASSGTTGKPTVVGYTKNDLELWSEVGARSVMSAGVTQDSIVQNSLGYGLFTGGLGLHYAAEKVGAQVIPMGGGNTQKQIMMMKDFNSTVLIATPSYALHLADVMEEMGMGPDDIPLKTGVLGAEPWSEEMKIAIESKTGMQAINSYGMSELIGPCVAMECVHQTGMHIWEDHFVPQIIDPVTGELLEEGQTGELVVTAMTKECLPMLRYRTKDIASITTEKCSCGRTMARIKRLSGRTDDMMIIRGVNVFPSQIESIIFEVQGVEPYYQLVLSTANGMTALEVKVEVSPEYFNDDIRRLTSLREEIGNRIKTFIGISAKITLCEPKSLPRSEGKAVRVIDQRTIK